MAWTQEQLERQARLGGILSALDDGASAAALLERTIGLVQQVHDSQQGEKEKLREKDRLLVLLIEEYRDRLDGFEAAPELHRLFNLLATILSVIEGILWELKRLPGNPPWSERGDDTEEPGGEGRRR